jgi:heme exporter protein A
LQDLVGSSPAARTINMNQLTANNLHLWRGEQHVLRGVQFSLEGGQCLQVTGANGAGKTTLLRALCGLVPVEEGHVRWRGQNIEADREAFHSELGYLGHDNGLKGDLTAAENLSYAARLRCRVQPGDVLNALTRLGAGELAAQRLRHMSAGQRRRVALARLTLIGGALWIMDEPGSNLDAQGQALVLEILRQHLQRGGAAVVATHLPLLLPNSQLRELVLQ